MMKRLVSIFFLFALLLATPVSAEDEDNVVVLELFTSQGCAMCPPANKLLKELAENRNVVALNWHVDYWDYLGWKDNLARPENTKRQEAYNEKIGHKGVFTPQAVVNGRRQVVGSHREELFQMIRSAADAAELPLDLGFSGGKQDLKINIEGPDVGENANIILVWYDSVQSINIRAGENKGKTITYSNVARRHEVIGTWNGENRQIPINLQDSERGGSDCIAVLVQDGPGGPILGAAKIILNDLSA